ncbi:hypothetical protein AVEN_52117-1 [Araneus ventricosus]|uniref:Uncharacterized protein n=1 Tax=Araneus ventricosus TaxID=182803 RepID=A0A4Y2E4V9_ARAVE|nr:hypothetical protein AVEN_52117-1 [Araneus ventricosus]
MHSPPESTHFFQRFGRILMSIQKGFRLAVYPLSNSLDDDAVVRKPHAVQQVGRYEAFAPLRTPLHTPAPGIMVADSLRSSIGMERLFIKKNIKYLAKRERNLHRSDTLGWERYSSSYCCWSLC